MTSEKAFERLKLAALEVKAILIEIDENIHPAASEIEKLQKALNELSECAAVYKFVKAEKEMSPNLNLHLKVMEKVVDKAEEAVVAKEMEAADKLAKEEAGATAAKAEVKKMEFNLNDKFRIINELFKQSTTEFNLAMEQLNSFVTLENSLVYLNQLKDLYHWRDDHELTKRIYQINQKRFQ